MRIAVTCDTLAHAAPVLDSLARLGHRAQAFEVGERVSRALVRLETWAPDLVFNLAHGRGNFAAALDQLGLRSTGSPAAACSSQRDGAVAGLLAAHEGIPTAEGRGVDYVVPFVAGAGRGGTLAPLEVRKDRLGAARLDKAHRGVLAAATRAVVEACGGRDLALVRLRVPSTGAVGFVSIDPVPSFEPKGALRTAAALDGISLDALVRAIVAAAAVRHGLAVARSPKPKAGALRVGFAFNVKRLKPKADGSDDAEAEYDSPKTLGSIRDAIASYGHEVIDLEADVDIAARLEAHDLDVVFNLAEGLRGRSREAVVPALCEHYDIEYTGSDPATLALALDKSLAKRVVAGAGVRVPREVLMTTGREPLPPGLGFPLIVKPVAEGSSKGVLPKSVVTNARDLRALASGMAARYGQPALVEEYVAGREFTVGLLGEGRGEVMPPMEVVFLDKKDPRPVYSFEHKLDWNRYIRYDAPAKLPPAKAKEMMRVAQDAFQALGCRDVARIDFRMTEAGDIYFIEANPLPGLTPGWSDLVLSAQGVQMDYRTLIGQIMKGAIRRYRARGEARRKVG